MSFHSLVGFGGTRLQCSICQAVLGTHTSKFRTYHIRMYIIYYSIFRRCIRMYVYVLCGLVEWGVRLYMYVRM